MADTASLTKSSQEIPLGNYQTNLSFIVDTPKQKAVKITLIFFQTNNESELLNLIHAQFAQSLAAKAQEQCINDFYVINPAAWGHYSVALRDALLGVQAKLVEVHLSNIHQREAFRHHSYLQDIAQGVICGLGAKGYNMALNYWLDSVSW
ncbi:hypothetical protein CKF58_07985 [Psittacicella hinzii]|uniref:3-dehydroquinate dehydratase n=1 Tax=Psittacicella hinzii TaxID=2028575 RepID=A0A3A1YBQ1_9GAMM|nr:hypothetical protein CKF58_07985 [Psittacicella hinzii]